MTDKVFDSPAAAVADIPDGASVAIAGFGISHRFPSSLIVALRDHRAKDLTVYCNGLGSQGAPTAQLLAENEQISRLVASFSSRPGKPTIAEEQILAGTIEFEVVPQGILVERMRAGGAGIPAFYTSVGVGTAVAEGKDVRYFDGEPYIMERGITTDYAILRGYRADRYGNVQFRGGSRNFNDSFAKAARTAIIEVEEIVDVGELEPEQIDLPGIFISRVVETTTRVDVSELPQRPARPADSRREYDGKPALSREEIGRRAAALLDDGAVINLGAGLPNGVVNYLDGRGVVLHAENGILNYGGFVELSEADPDFHDAGGNFIGLLPGVSFFDSVTSFEIARGKRLDAVILGAYQVGADGDLANWAHPGRPGGGIGGAMDLAVGARSVIVTMEHVDSRGRPKLVQRCDYPITAAGCTDVVVTDLALLRRGDDGFILEEIAAGFTVDEVLARTGMTVQTVENPRVMQEQW
ncbi:3-oxoacid CoA-transferase [Phytoactinopolyspora halotolerans]|uniref:3-oxoacid CoA-transferase subunit A n=1 Tax=Phytoactinopolyspora halotolerans TaxID=1981512 RepID=A0A6L9S911_9ACTN|nr:3-oxoacid CoA-transferase [Phytoactinopolyspora halotolerans]NEE00460.1 3-oxoacid CoA-transferase subunit A [Phytoactinopolyspora halotolerans]